MDNDTVFYILGIGLVLAALTVGFLGVRLESFPPSRPVLLIGTAVFVLLVVGTTTFAWRNAEDEQASRDAKHASEAQANTGESTTTTETSTTAGTSTTTTASVDGAQVFEDQGCGGCHTLEAAGSTGTTGPVFDSVLKGKDEDFIRTSIVDPNAEIEKGFPPNVMPQSYGDILSPEELDALVKYLFESTNSKG